MKNIMKRLGIRVLMAIELLAFLLVENALFDYMELKNNVGVTIGVLIALFALLFGMLIPAGFYAKWETELKE